MLTKAISGACARADPAIVKYSATIANEHRSASIFFLQNMGVLLPVRTASVKRNQNSGVVPTPEIGAECLCLSTTETDQGAERLKFLGTKPHFGQPLSTCPSAVSSDISTAAAATDHCFQYQAIVPIL